MIYTGQNIGIINDGTKTPPTSANPHPNTIAPAGFPLCFAPTQNPNKPPTKALHKRVRIMDHHVLDPMNRIFCLIFFSDYLLWVVF